MEAVLTVIWSRYDANYSTNTDHLFICLLWHCGQWAKAYSFLRFLDHIRRISVSRTALN